MSAKKKRIKVPERPAEERINDFKEVSLGYTPEQAIKEANRCLQCENRPCTEGCPVGINIPLFIKKIREEKFREALEILKKDNFIPAITGRVCPQEDQCENRCTMRKMDDPINIGKLERFVADYVREKDREKEPEKKKKNKGSIGIVGSGPSGITCAGTLSKSGYDVSIYEALHEAGGVLKYGIPEFRLPNEIINHELDYLKKLGVEIKVNKIVGQNIFIDEIEEIHDAIYVATGAGAPRFLGLEGENLNGIYSANEFLTRINLMKAYKFPEYDTPITDMEKVAIIGGGNVAIDSARSALRLGAESHILYRRTVDWAPAREEEIQHAKEEGVQFDCLCSPIKFIGDQEGWLKEIEFCETELCEPNGSGRPKPKSVEDSRFRKSFDTAIIAIGQKPNKVLHRNTSGLEVRDDGRIIIDDKTRNTTREKVYAGGDAVSGIATVIQAMGDGQKAARSIEKNLEP
ncbi:MAG: NADPH-dependent glutamate synthase [Candidatus Hadarchaeota archaeon]